MKRHPSLLSRSRCVLVVVDLQTGLLPALWDADAALENALRLVRGAKLLGVPILSTTQYAARLGALAPELDSELHDSPRFDKMTFSCAGADGFLDTISSLGRDQVAICGAETHICICQSALDLAHAGWSVQVVADAVTARSAGRHELGLARLVGANIALTATESALYEWLERAGTDDFKAILPLVR